MQHEDVQPDKANTDIDTNRHTLQRVKDKTKATTRRVLHIDSTEGEDGEKDAYDAAVEELNDSPAFNTSKFLKKSRIGPSGGPDKFIALLQSTVHAVVDPKAAIKSRASRKTAGKLSKDRPYLSRQADLDFLEAHDDLERAQGTQDINDDEETAARKDEDVGDRAKRIQDLENKRHNMRVAWVTGRHVQRVRVVDAVAPPPFPDDSFFIEEDDCGFPAFNWEKWIGYKLMSGSHGFSAQYIDDFETLPFDSDTLRRHIERLIIVSAPLQAFNSNIRSIYRWDDPVRTAKWMAVYWFLWYISHIMTYLYGYIIFSAVRNYYYPASLSELRASIKRTIDREATAFKAGEMDKHGNRDWLGPLVEKMGPVIQVQIVDFANILEAAYNFYHFQSPSASRASLCLFGALFLLSAIGDAKFALKVFWFIIGLIFFICWPISSHWPRYRLLVSPFKWALWDVPTYAEWCFQYLQERSAVAREAITSRPSDNTYIRTGAEPDYDSDAESFHSATSIQLDEDRDILSFGCTYLHVPGRFIISTHALRFVSSTPLPYTSFHEPYTSLVEMSKRQTRSSILSPLAKVTTGMDKLELWFRGEGGTAGMNDMGEVGRARRKVLDNMRGRDKAFNAVIGFSGLRWQHLQKMGKVGDGLEKERGEDGGAV